MSTNNINNDISFLIVDDEPQILSILSSLIKKTYPDNEVLTASDGLAAWNLIQQRKPSVVISEFSLPFLNGMEICSKIRKNEELHHIYFILISEISDQKLKISALENGADDFINKPITYEELLAKLKSSTRMVELQQNLMIENKLLVELADILENDIRDMTHLSIKFLQARIPSSKELLTNVSNISVWIAKHFDQLEHEQLQDIEIASHLCYSGRVFLSDNLLQTPVLTNGQVTNQIMYQVPISGKEIVSSVKRFKDVGDIIYHIYENFDGSGFPGRLQSWQIPLGSRIIRVALDFEELRLFNKKTPKEAIELIYRESKRLYDHRIVTLLEQYLAVTNQSDKSLKEKAVQLHELTDGMILSRDVITNAGLKLMPSGATLRENTISKILSHNSNDPILGNIFIRI